MYNYNVLIHCIHFQIIKYNNYHFYDIHIPKSGRCLRLITELATIYEVTSALNKTNSSSNIYLCLISIHFIKRSKTLISHLNFLEYLFIDRLYIFKLNIGVVKN